MQKFLWAQKQSNLRDFLNHDENKSKVNFKSKSWNQKNKNMTSEKQKFNKILLQKLYIYIMKLSKENVPKNGVEHTKCNEKFYFYLYLLSI